MKVTDRIKKFMNRNNPESIAGNVADAYLERKANKEKDPMDHTADDAIKVLKKHPSSEDKILAKIIENPKMPDEMLPKIATRISKDPEIPDSVIPAAVNRAETSISPESINNILENGEVNEKDRIELIKQVEDIKSKKEGAKRELKELYKICYEKRDSEVTSRIEEIEAIFDKEDIDEEIKGWIQTVIAKKMAENYYSDIKQGTKIFTFTKIIPIEDMIEKDLPSAVENEYNKIEEDRKIKKDRFNKEEFKQQVLAELGKQIGIKYEETGIFIVPQSENIKKMNEEEKTKFIKAIQTYARRPLTRDEIIDIDEQIRGTSNSLQIKENTIINLIKKIPKEEKNNTINMLTKIVKDKEYMETIEILNDTGLLEKLKGMPKDKRQKTVETINNAINKRTRYSIEKKSPKINSVKFEEKPIIKEER